MRVAIVYFPESKSSKLGALAQEAARGIESQGKQYELINGYTDMIRGGMFSYLCFCVEGKTAFGSKIDPRFSSCLDQASSITGKRASVLMQKKLMFSQKTMQRYMRAIEGQGVFLRNSLVVEKQGEAQSFTAKLDLEPPSRV